MTKTHQTFKIVREPTVRTQSGENYTLGRMYLGTIERDRQSFGENQDKPLQNIIDTACGLYATTLYKLRRFP